MEKVVKSKKQTREQQLTSLFGPAKNGVPAESVTYIRKNPKRTVKKLASIYGLESIVKWLGSN